MKIESDIAFIKTCKREQVIPIFAKVKLHKKKTKTNCTFIWVRAKNSSYI